MKRDNVVIVSILLLIGIILLLFILVKVNIIGYSIFNGGQVMLSPALQMNTASRTNCVAPCGVFFDATSSMTNVIQPLDGEHANLIYDWNYGDLNSGVWSTDGRSKK